ncbi:hypothetical protein D917_09761, partial [Trichinella nativa]
MAVLISKIISTSKKKWLSLRKYSTDGGSSENCAASSQHAV